RVRHAYRSLDAEGRRHVPGGITRLGAIVLHVAGSGPTSVACRRVPPGICGIAALWRTGGFAGGYPRAADRQRPQPALESGHAARGLARLGGAFLRAAMAVG